MVSNFDDVTFKIINHGTNEVLFPTIYNMLRVNKDSKGSIFFEFGSKIENKHVYLSFIDSELLDFIEMLEKALNNKNSNIEDSNWFLFYYPSFSNEDDDLWMCKLKEISRQNDKILIILNWVYFKEDQEDAINTIKKFADSDVIKKLEKSFNNITEFQTDEARGVILEISERTKLHFFDIEKDFSRIDAAMEILKYKKFGKYLMRKNPESEPRDIIIEMSLFNVEGTIIELKKLKTI